MISSRFFYRARIASKHRITDLAAIARVSVGEYMAFEAGKCRPNCQQTADALLACKVRPVAIMQASQEDTPSLTYRCLYCVALFTSLLLIAALVVKVIWCASTGAQQV